MQYITMAEQKQLDTLTCFREMKDVALAILKRMPQPIIQVCGPISTGGAGNKEDNLKLFAHAIHVMKIRGFIVFNQLMFQDAMMRLVEKTDHKETLRKDILEIFYRGVFESGYIHATWFVPDWHTSDGSHWERDFVPTCNIPIHDMPANWLA